MHFSKRGNMELWYYGLYVDVVLCSWRIAVYASCWESVARRFWCWRETTRPTARLCLHCSPAQMSVWGRAKGQHRLRVYKPPFTAALQIPQSSITGSWWPPCAPWMSISEGFCRKSLWNLGFDYFSISPSSCLQAGKVQWPNWLIQPYHLWNDL